MIVSVLVWMLAIYCFAIAFVLLAGAAVFAVGSILLLWSRLIRYVRAKYGAAYDLVSVEDPLFDVTLWSSAHETVRQIDLPDGRAVTSRIQHSRSTLHDL